MKAARLHSYGGPLVVEEVPTPEPGDGQVVVKVEGAGFCHSDLHIIDGEVQLLPVMPITLGHENAGVVSQVGRGVTEVKEGDNVAVYGGWGCGHCKACVSGDEHLCIQPRWVGMFGYDGGYAEYLLVPNERYLVKLGRVATREAAVLTDAAVTPYRAIKKALPFLSPDRHVLVIGAGGVGQFGIKLLKLLCASPIIAVEIDDEKLKAARDCGADEALDGRSPDLAAKILELSGGGVQVALDFVGNDQTLALALGMAATGGKVVQVGLAGGTANIQVMQNSRFEVQFEASFWGNLNELREVIALAECGRLTPVRLDYYPLDQINDVCRLLKEGRVPGRAVITPSG